MRRWLVVLLAAAVLPAQAGLFDDDEARQRIEKLRQDFDELNKRVEVVGRNQIDFANQTETLKGDLARLRGQIEVILNDLETTQKRQKDFYVDLDNRLRKLEASAVEVKDEAKAETKSVDPAQEMRDYEAALTAFRGGNFKDALSGFLGFVKNYPNSSFQPSGHFWAASSYYQLKDYPRAAETFGELAAKWPSDARAPDALMAQANALAEAGDVKGSRKALETLVDKYPASAPAQAAKQRLKSTPPPKKK